MDEGGEAMGKIAATFIALVVSASLLCHAKTPAPRPSGPRLYEWSYMAAGNSELTGKSTAFAERSAVKTRHHETEARALAKASEPLPFSFCKASASDRPSSSDGCTRLDRIGR
jgi:hypothetical protein